MPAQKGDAVAGGSALRTVKRNERVSSLSSYARELLQHFLGL